MADAVRTDVPGIARYRRLSGITTTEGRPWSQQLLRSRWLWASLVLTLGFLAAVVRMYVILSPDRQVEGGTIPGLNSDALWTAAGYALPTLAGWAVVFLLLERWRPQRLLRWIPTTRNIF